MNEPQTTAENEQRPHHHAAIFPGIILIIIGLAFLVANIIPGWSWGFLWPIFVLAPGLGFWLLYIRAFNRERVAGVLIPGTILVLFAVFFFIMEMLDWQHMDRLWPTFLLVPGLSFFVFFFARGQKSKGILVPTFILLILAAVFYALATASWKFWPILLIVAGIAILIPRRTR